MYDKLARKGNRTKSRRRIFEDGRVTDQVEFWAGTREVEVWSSDEDWRSAIDVAIQSDPAGTFDNGIVRLYAKTGNTRSLVKQGRYNAPVVNRTRLVLSVRSVPCDDMIVTVQGVLPVTPPLVEANKVRLSVGMHGFEPSKSANDITITQEIAASTPVTLSPAGFTGYLYGFYATLGTASATRYIWFSDTSAFSTFIIPPVPISAGGIASLDISDNPIASEKFTSATSAGLFVALSDTFSTFTQSGDFLAINVKYT